MPPASYALGLGSNRRHGRFGAPRAVVAAAIAALAAEGLRVIAQSRIVETAPLGPSARRFANAVVLVETALCPPAVLALVKRIERRFGRRRGRRWGARVIDVDLLLWSGGRWRGPGLSVPHPAMAVRRFVLDPLAEIAGIWRVEGGSVQAMRFRLMKARRSRENRP
ncbi:2-amino-4-hydroxy-6-hydroxymethyldihydropteridine diphosphokinase [Sphingomonas naphthae]|uniref:2-amino-4-hydroxy-6-hydroxymethyldihydropteridine pyrophosphokinase n=1 Tax=Sphingomonas naphthae TaxID=1813468 RepID=A0ABY7TGB6_9SPHN|nr:2-amino-4-hydroxy-6-hydroxymethyldihydropteridine diphosphokinase [Sphingomonas naphthae]WCT72271.1 2-amino-4-hydroxy-6-hydroxymethyldihydropteridine diphosphokinase [Sphingomonas naphthae]